MIRIAICDDNEIQTEIMRGFMAEYSSEVSTRQVSCSFFQSGRELLQAVEEGAVFDIYLLDLIMPDINGMEVASILRHRGSDAVIIFITASTEYAVVSYDVRAFYYMLKPIDPAKLFKVLDNAVESIKPDETEVLIHGKNGDHTISIGDIAYVDLVNRVPKYHLKDGRCIDLPMLRSSFKQLSDPLLRDERFTACGASLVLNMSYIDVAASDSILLRDGTQLHPPVSAWSSLKKSLAGYKKSKE